ncbi:hypothetical protein PM082_009758 [Marasmius tenuissimus]|nr:hypothetical protein PM082_009758 [Marasmius tenuissimus]
MHASPLAILSLVLAATHAALAADSEGPTRLMIQTLKLKDSLAKLAKTTKAFYHSSNTTISQAFIGAVLSDPPLSAIQWFVIPNNTTTQPTDFLTPFLPHTINSESGITQTYVTLPNTSLLLSAARDGLYTQTSITTILAHVDRVQLEADSYVLAKSAMEDGGAYASTYGYGDGDGEKGDVEYVVISGWEVPSDFDGWKDNMNETMKATFVRWVNSLADVPPPRFITNFVEL